MALNIGESQAAMDLLRFLMKQSPQDLDERLKNSLITLHAGAYKTLAAGISQWELVEALYPRLEDRPHG